LIDWVLDTGLLVVDLDSVGNLGIVRGEEIIIGISAIETNNDCSILLSVGFFLDEVVSVIVSRDV